MFPALDFERKAGRFRKQWAYLEVTEPSDVFEAPTAFPVRHSGWEQAELAGAGMEFLRERVEVLSAAGLWSSSIVREFLAQRLAPLQRHSRPMWLYAGPSDPMRLSATPLVEATTEKM